MAATSSRWPAHLSYNGLANAVTIAAINGGTHSFPSFAGDDLRLVEVLDKVELPGAPTLARCGCGPWRPRISAAPTSRTAADGKYLPNVVLDLDYTVLMPRRWGLASEQPSPLPA